MVESSIKEDVYPQSNIKEIVDCDHIIGSPYVMMEIVHNANGFIPYKSIIPLSKLRLSDI
jgi:hypothetical protein